MPREREEQMERMKKEDGMGYTERVRVHKKTVYVSGVKTSAVK